LKAIIHIGQQKTGSTILQEYLSQSRDQLLSQGILYPKCLGNNKQHKLLSEHDNLLKEESGLQRSLKSEIFASKSNTVLISEENLFSIPQNKIEVIAQFLKKEFNEITIVVSLRRQYDHFLSLYQQKIRGRSAATIKEVFEQKYFDEKYQYYSILKRWKIVFPSAHFIIRPYGHLKNGDSVDDFLSLFKIKKRDQELKTNFANTNKSFDAESIELIRNFNLLESNNQFTLTHQRKRQLRVYLKNKTRNQKFNLNSQDRIKIWERFLDENKKLCSSFDLKGYESYFLQEPKIIAGQPIYNQNIDKDQLYDLFFEIFES